jgi:hypothetical protein
MPKVNSVCLTIVLLTSLMGCVSSPQKDLPIIAKDSVTPINEFSDSFACEFVSAVPGNKRLDFFRGTCATTNSYLYMYAKKASPTAAFMEAITGDDWHNQSEQKFRLAYQEMELVGRYGWFRDQLQITYAGGSRLLIIDPLDSILTENNNTKKLHQLLLGKGLAEYTTGSKIIDDHEEGRRCHSLCRLMDELLY